MLTESSIGPFRYRIAPLSDTKEAMSFGWILETKTGRPLVQNYGPGFGIPSSHRAEAWGMLSGARFLLHLTMYTRTPFPEHIKVESMSDNKGLIQGTTDRQTYANVYANSTLAPDWDITEEMHTTFEALKLMNQAFTKVKGHQDGDTSYDALPVEAKYNVQADDLADQFMMHQYRKARMLSPLLPAAKYMLQIDTRTHCAHFTKTIRQAITLPELFAYLATKYAWSPRTHANVDWDTLQAAANNYQASDNHLLKLVYNQLPTRKHNSKSESWVPSQCRHCTHPENFNHLMQCIQHISVQFHQTLPNAVQRHCNVYDAPRSFTSIIVQALRDWLDNTPVLQNTETLECSHPTTSPLPLRPQ
jgi:hypothetical protein